MARKNQWQRDLNAKVKSWLRFNKLVDSDKWTLQYKKDITSKELSLEKFGDYFSNRSEVYDTYVEDGLIGCFEFKNGLNIHQVFDKCGNLSISYDNFNDDNTACPINLIATNSTSRFNNLTIDVHNKTYKTIEFVTSDYKYHSGAQYMFDTRVASGVYPPLLYYHPTQISYSCTLLYNNCIVAETDSFFKHIVFSCNNQYNSNIKVGSRFNNVEYINIKIHAIRIYDRDLTYDEVVNNYKYELKKFSGGDIK